MAYLSRGDCFGEMALVLDAPRQATCIAYDHPASDSKRKPGRVELVRIDGAAFKKLLDTSDELTSKVNRLVSRRYADIVGSDLRAVGTADASLRHSKEYQDEGLAQGKSLLLIDLDRCTRCGDCVRACQETYDDGHSRLYLDGPRFDQFLIPSACRQCLNPSCMIGCPVGSIQRGDNGQIEIGALAASYAPTSAPTIRFKCMTLGSFPNRPWAGSLHLPRQSSARIGKREVTGCETGPSAWHRFCGHWIYSNSSQRGRRSASGNQKMRVCSSRFVFVTRSRFRETNSRRAPLACWCHPKGLSSKVG